MATAAATVSAAAMAATVQLTVLDVPESRPALALYRSLGFRPTGFGDEDSSRGAVALIDLALTLRSPLNN